MLSGEIRLGPFKVLVDVDTLKVLLFGINILNRK